jgi:hypothetical protein
MAQLPKELHETILAEVMRRKRLAENVAINAVWRAFQRLGGYLPPRLVVHAGDDNFKLVRSGTATQRFGQ